ncbi:MAG: glucose-6-phosphate 1-dehydrogenase [Gallionellaceae bacterium]|nr:MAG: glucose-6-phosphate 1-dehydrogenase [Gallionellaceae bacterium]
MKKIEPCTLVIFGAGGNLSRRKLLPALFRLEMAKRLPDNVTILGCDIALRQHEEWLDWVAGVLRPIYPQGIDEAALQRFCARLHYFATPLGDDAAYLRLQQLLENESSEFHPNVMYYMSVRPSEFPKIVEKLGGVGLLKEKNGWRRLVIEKPFGYDLLSAQTLQASLYRHVNEPQIYRIDHYLGKGTVQKGRADYYEGAGALRDMIQSHLLQLLALVAMEPPVTMSAEHLRDEKVKALKAIRPITQNSVHAHAFRGQYTSGTIDGVAVPGYLEEPGVAEDSTTETYAALKLFVDNWRWAGVPFYLRTGKRMAETCSTICIRFKNPPQDLLKHARHGPPQPNWIMLGIQPNDCLKMEMQVKVPGLDLHTRTISLDATYRKEGDEDYDAYAGLLLDVMQGDHSLFLRIDEVETAWRVVDPVLKVWSMERDFINGYQAGSWGPRGTYRLFDRDDQFWRHSLNPEGAELQAY